MKTTDTHVYFWSGIYSNFHPCRFTIGQNAFNCSEQAFMYFKAIEFGDEAIADQIMSMSEPRDQKALGKQIRGFDEDIWSEKRFDHMQIALLGKFSQNEDLANQLVLTGERILVEASPYDKIWGVGLREDDPAILDASNWQGLNLLGQALMSVRDILREQAR